MSPLDNPIWHSLNSRHAHLAIGSADARRYPPTVAPFVALPEVTEQSVAALQEIVELGDTVGVLAVIPDLPWRVLRDITLHQYAFPDSKSADVDDEAVLLDERHLPAMLELTALVYPHYFRPETARLGPYYGLFDGERLAAMAGTRMSMPGFQEISAICTHPDYRGKGLASRLTLHLVRKIIDVGEQAFLHTEFDNPAQAMYQKLGFELRQKLPFRVYERNLG